MITHQKMSLFNAPEGSIIIHACNAQGVWGSGIAKEFKTRYPESFKNYEAHCKEAGGFKGPALGTGKLGPWPENEPHYVGWIITSENYGSKKDNKTAILANTALALRHVCSDAVRYRKYAGLSDEITIYSNKFNSGLFAVPWNESEEVLKQVLKHYPSINWIVCSPE